MHHTDYATHEYIPPFQTSTRSLRRYVSADVLLTTEYVNWPGVKLYACRIPPHPRGLILPRIPDHTVMLLLGGPFVMRRRIREQGPWTERRILPGSLTIWPAGTESTWVHEAEIEALHLHVHPDRLAQVTARLRASGSGQVQNGEARAVTLQPCLGIRDRVAEHTLLTLKALLERAETTTVSEAHADALVSLLAEHLVKTYGESQPPVFRPPGSLSRPKLRRVLRFIREHLHDPVSVADLAALVNVSPFHFSRLFRARTGKAPHQFVIERRLEEAERLLLETDTPVVRIARRVGYRDASHFAALFRRHLGLTPSMYRERYSA